MTNKGLVEAYYSIYNRVEQPVEVETTEISEELLDKIIDELAEELVEEGHGLDEAYSLLEEAVVEYLDEAKVTYGSDTESPEQRRERAKAKVGEKRASARKAAVKGAVGRVKAKASAVKAGVQIAGSIAKDEARRAGRAAVQGVKSGVEKKKKEVKSGIKGFLGKAAKKVASKASSVAAKLGEEVEALKASGKFSEKEIEAFISIDENRAAARAAGGYKDDSKKQTDPSKAGFTGISGSIKDIMRQNKEIEARNKKK